MASERRTGFRPIAHLCFAGMLRAMRTAEKFATGFHAVADDLAMAVTALRRECVNRTLETVEGVGLVVLDGFERLVVVVAADFASRHIGLLCFHLRRLRGAPNPLHRAPPAIAIGAFLCCPLATCAPQL